MTNDYGEIIEMLKNDENVNIVICQHENKEFWMIGSISNGSNKLKLGILDIDKNNPKFGELMLCFRTRMPVVFEDWKRNNSFLSSRKNK